MERIGLIGMGLMGQAFIKNLHKSNFIVQGFDIDAERMDQLAEAGGVPVDTPAAVVQDVKCVIISLPTSDITQEVGPKTNHRDFEETEVPTPIEENPCGEYTSEASPMDR